MKLELKKKKINDQFFKKLQKKVTLLSYTENIFYKLNKDGKLKKLKDILDEIFTGEILFTFQ